MSSLTKAQFRDECKTRSSAISSFSDTVIEKFIDIALRAYSQKLPELRVSAGNAIVDGQELYAFPAGAESIIKITDADTGAEITFAVTDEGSGNKIRLGNIKLNSYNDLLEADYYDSPINRSEAQATGYDTFDIEYTLLYDITSIGNTALEALYYHILASAYEDKAETAMIASETEITTTPTSITDRDARGESTQVSYGSRTAIAKQYSDLSNKAIEQFNQIINKFAYGIRG
jgi:hypothetical protein